MLYAKWCKTVYEDTPSSRKWECGQEMSWFYDSTTDTEACLIKNRLDNTHAFVFRGSESLLDWRTNLNTKPYKLSDSVTVHRGFWNSWKSIRPEILKMAYEYDSLTICGHSLGGALAVLCAYDIASVYPDIELTLITFGQPKVGNKEFARKIDDLIPLYYRVVNQMDPVPFSPFFFQGNFCHAGKRLQLGNFWSGLFKTKIPQHAIDSYVKVLQRNTNNIKPFELY